MNAKVLLSVLAMLGLAACSTVPRGPSVMALPGTTKTFDQFMIDDAACKQFASQQVTPNRERDSVLTGAAVGTAIGAVAGAAIGGRNGAAVGAGMGMATGAVVGSGHAQSEVRGGQRQYDQIYVQCMYGRGHRVPVQGTLTESPSRPASVPPPPPQSSMPPPPPPGPPPSPPPR